MYTKNTITPTSEYHDWGRENKIRYNCLFITFDRLITKLKQTMLTDLKNYHLKKTIFIKIFGVVITHEDALLDGECKPYGPVATSRTHKCQYNGIDSPTHSYTFSAIHPPAHPYTFIYNEHTCSTANTYPSTHKRTVVLYSVINCKLQSILGTKHTRFNKLYLNCQCKYNNDGTFMAHQTMMSNIGHHYWLYI